MEIQGHRGFGKLAPFNSIRAFTLASRLGLDSIEFDIRILKDKTLVVSHGPEIGDGKIESLTWEEASILITEEIDLQKEASNEQDIGIFGAFKDAGDIKSEISTTSMNLAKYLLKWYEKSLKTKVADTASAGLDESFLTTPQTIPKFEDVCKICLIEGIIMNIELKTTDSSDNEELVNEVLKVVKKYDPEFKQSRISSFNHEILWIVQKKEPGISVGALFNPGLNRDQESGKMIRAETPKNFLQNLRSHMDSVNFCAETLKIKEIEEAHNAGLKVLAWFPGVPDGPEDFATFTSLEKMGVDVLCTNRPDIAMLDYRKMKP